MNYKIRADLDLTNNNFDSLFIKIQKRCNTCNIIILIGIIYQPPKSDSKKSTESLNKFLIKNRDVKTYMLFNGEL